MGEEGGGSGKKRVNHILVLDALDALGLARMR
jgi:hypothetical protein